MLRDLISKRDQIIQKQETINKVIGELLNEATFIENLEQVASETLQRYNLKVTKAEVQRQMKE